MIKRFGLFTITVLLLGSCIHLPRDVRIPEVWHRKPVRASDLTLRQQVAQMIIVRVEGYYYSSDNGYRKKVERWVADDQIGGLITFRGSVDGTFTNLQRFQRLAPLPLLVAADFEQGVGQQIEGATRFPSNMAMAATFNEENVYAQGRVTALEARGMGIHVAFAPVLDVNNNPNNPIINFRSYSDDPELVARMGSAFIRGAQEHGLMACAKHYPGHGNTSTDSHTSLPLIPGSRESLEQMELLPFKAAIDAGVGMVMVGHIAVPGLDDSNSPATQSNTITEDLLRGEYGFGGLIVTDGMEMGAISGGNWTGEAAVRSIEAGNDIILLPLYVDQTIDAVVQAVETGRVSQERIAASVNRILKLKEDLGLYEERLNLNRADVQHSVGLAEFRTAARAAALESITLIKDKQNLIPLRPGRGKTLTHILISMDDDLMQRTITFSRNVEFTFGSKRVKTFFVNDQLSPTRIRELVNEAKTSSRTLVTALVRIHMDKGISTIDSTHKQLLEILSDENVSFVVVSFGSPYMPALDHIPAYLCAYGYGGVSMRAMSDAIFGRAPISGRLPVNLDAKHPRGSGINKEALTKVFGEMLRNSPPLRGDLSRAFAVLDSAIREKITPGAQVFVAKGGLILADTAFGHFTYPNEIPLEGEEALPVTTASIYDLASLTKVLVGGTLAMRLVDGRYLVLDEPVWHYIPSFRGRWKDRVTIRHLLTHTSGLPQYIEFWRMGIKPDRVIDTICKTDLEFEPGTQVLYSGVGMILFSNLVELVAAQRLENLAWSWVLEPLMMESTGYNPPEEWLERIIPTEVDAQGRKGLIHGDVHDANANFMGGVSLHSGAFAPANQLAILGMLYLNGGVIYGRRLAQEETVDAFITPQILNDGSESGWAMTWQLASATTEAGSLFSPSAFGHTGFTGTSIWIDPMTEVIVVLLTNRVYPSGENAERIREVRRRFHDEVILEVQRSMPGT
ncbi:MAG: serine hydrolase [Fidelibacterota bacterium]|nr:MAG: serine hydrolase [Candidatus Neomarinimicrobiota bacterium]